MPQPDPTLLAGCQAYNKRYGLPPISEGLYVTVDDQLGRTIAQAYEELPVCDTANLTVCVAFTHLAVEVCQQYAFLTQDLGIRIDPWVLPGQPYASSSDMSADVR